MNLLLDILMICICPRVYFAYEFDYILLRFVIMATRGVKQPVKGGLKKKIERPGLTEDEIEELK